MMLLLIVIITLTHSLIRHDRDNSGTNDFFVKFVKEDFCFLNNVGLSNAYSKYTKTATHVTVWSCPSKQCTGCIDFTQHIGDPPVNFETYNIVNDFPTHAPVDDMALLYFPFNSQNCKKNEIEHVLFEYDPQKVVLYCDTYPDELEEECVDTVNDPENRKIRYFCRGKKILYGNYTGTDDDDDDIDPKTKARRAAAAAIGVTLGICVLCMILGGIIGGVVYGMWKIKNNKEGGKFDNLKDKEKPKDYLKEQQLDDGKVFDYNFN